jgi:hypothetical protein
VVVAVTLVAVLFPETMLERYEQYIATIEIYLRSGSRFFAIIESLRVDWSHGYYPAVHENSRKVAA